MAPDSLFLFVGIGITDYKHFTPLPRAVLDVRDLAALLETRRYNVKSTENPTDPEARLFLRETLEGQPLPLESALVVLWSGHGVSAPGKPLHLIATDSKPGSAPDITPDFLAELVARSGARQVLVLLDTCHSGGGVFEVARAFDLVRREQADEPGWLGVLASALDFERAKDGMFVGHLIRLLREGPSNPALRTRWSSHNEGVRGDDVIDALLKEWGEPGQRPKQLSYGSAWPMFPNPRYDSEASESVVEHLLLAAQGRAPDEEGTYFTGRTAQINQLVSWMGTDGPGVFLIVGPAGSGKSAIAGRIVSVSSPMQRAAILGAGPFDHADPGEGAVAAHVHARRLTLDQVASRIDSQLVSRELLPKLTTDKTRDRVDLLRDLQQVASIPVIVLDGVDEAGSEAWAITRDLVAPLAQYAKIVIATRELAAHREGEPTLVQSLSASETIDLGFPDLVGSTTNDVRDYVHRRLADTEHTSMNTAAAADAIVRVVTSTNEGAFLLARVITSQLRQDPVDTSKPDWEVALSRSIAEAFERDLARSSDPALLRTLLKALAWAYGSGLPDDVWPVIATALAVNDTLHTRDDVHWALAEGGRYIVEDGDAGRAVYRLSHQRLVDLLLHPPTSSGKTT